MEVVGAAASVSQLTVYIHAAAKCLHRLYKTSQAAAFSGRSQLEDLDILLKILDRMSRRHPSLDSEILVPVLISTANTAQTLCNWFGQAATFRQSWVLFLRHADIEEAFRLLRQKCNLLAFYCSERNNCALHRIESSLHAQNNAAGRSDIITSPEQREARAMEDTVEPKSDTSQALVLRHDTSTSHNSSHAAGGVDANRDQRASNLFKETLMAQLFRPETNASSRRMRSEQPQDKRQGKGSATTRKINVSGNKFEKTKADLFNNTSRVNGNFEGIFDGNEVSGEHINVGNEAPYRDSNESDQNGRP